MSQVCGAYLFRDRLKFLKMSSVELARTEVMAELTESEVIQPFPDGASGYRSIQVAVV
jgi:hypothetical protein